MLPRLSSSYSVLFIIFLTALAVRILIFTALLLTLGGEIFVLGDTIGYVGMGQHLLNGFGFSATDAAGNPYLQDFRPPLYAILAAVSLFLTGGTTLLLILQIFCASLVPALTYQLGREFISHRKSLFLAAGAAIVEPLLVFFSFFLLTDILFLFFFMLALLFAVRFLKSPSYWSAGWAGLTLGLATLVRAVGEFFAIYFVIFVIFGLLFERSKIDILKKLLFFVFVFVLVIAPWIVRNVIVFNNLSVSSEGPWLLYFDLVPSLYSINYNLPFYEARKLVNKQLRMKYPKEELMSAPHRIQPSILVRESLDLIRQQYRGLPKLFLINAMWFFTHDNYAYHLDRFGVLPDRPRNFSPTFILMTEGWAGVKEIFSYLKSVYFIPLIARLFWVAISLMTLLGVASLWRQAKNFKDVFILVFLAGTIVYFFLLSSTIGFTGEGRIRIPVMPLLFLFAAYGFWQLVDWSNLRRLKQ